ncbi:uncharacterized protein LOC121763447 isoform X2 [Salvia splendens]|uniref:uncharacterized protein LOC121763447 isoform X2 n=1 Tax=Salvia splendens TaxID=180675 RepID=UPI001C255F47|nr:uncharacterized protein LOC121763447 isoform X2 [Salvia splendens]
MKNIRNRGKAQDRWEKLRKYVRYTWGACSLDDRKSELNQTSCTGIMMKSLHHRELSHKQRVQDRSNAASLSNKDEWLQKVEAHNTQAVGSCSTVAPKNLVGRSSFSICKPEEPPNGSLDCKSYEGSSEGRKWKKENAAMVRDKLKAALAKMESSSTLDNEAECF